MNKPQRDITKISKFLSFVLRHKPEAIGLQLDPQGWTDIDELIAKAHQSGEMTALDRGLIETTVESNDKKRFVISEDGKSIRASQGHSVNVDLQLTPKQPPDVLYHGTASRFLDSIKANGLKPGQRQYVHLSEDTGTALQVGQRYGKPVVLVIDAKEMHLRGMKFFQAENGVWLTQHVATKFIKTEQPN